MFVISFNATLMFRTSNHIQGGAKRDATVIDRVFKKPD